MALLLFVHHMNCLLLLINRKIFQNLSSLLSRSHDICRTQQQQQHHGQRHKHKIIIKLLLSMSLSATSNDETKLKDNLIYVCVFVHVLVLSIKLNGYIYTYIFIIRWMVGWLFGVCKHINMSSKHTYVNMYSSAYVYIKVNNGRLPAKCWLCL